MTDIERMTQERAQAQQELKGLTAMEREVLVLLSKGMSSDEIAAARRRSVKTVEAQRHFIRRRLDMTLIEAAVLAAKAGWV